MKVVTVVAAYDEEETIEALARRIHAVFQGMEDVEGEMLFVVEGRDRTREILESLSAEIPGLRILYRPEPAGLAEAFRRGFAAVPADTDYVVTLDADLNHQPEEIPRLLARMEQSGCDILVGSRFLEASRVEGTPLWKRLLSGSVNVLLRWLYGITVLDKTSGFRVYRAEALRRVEFRSQGFAFLPEMLIRANRMGLQVAEEPIHFIFRRQGRSKMAFWHTSLSYLTLLGARLDARTAAVLILLLAGIAVRIAISFPAHKYVGDADSLMTGMRAFHVLRGETPVFFSGTRIGSIEPHAAAAVFLVAGASRTTLALVPVLFGCALLLVLWSLYRELFPAGVALWALVFAAIPSPAFLSWTYMPNGYAATLFLCGAILWLAALLERRGPGRSRVVLFGIAAGLGWWQSFQTLGVLGPALAWLLWRRPELWRRPRLWALGLAGFVLGASPWIAYNIVWPLKTFRGNYAVRPAQGVEAVAANLRYFFTYSLPEIVTPVSEAWRELLDDPAADLHDALRLPVRLVFLAAALLFLAARRKVGSSPWLLTVLVIAAYAALNVFSEAGQARMVSVRYVLPIYLLVPGMLAFLVSQVSRRSRALAALLVATVLLFNVAGYHWPGRASREGWSKGARWDERLTDLLRRRGVTAVVGGYWTAYPINFLSQERILALPCSSDQYDYRTNRAPGRLHRWALVSAWPDELERWAARAGVSGPVELAAPQRAVLFLQEEPGGPEEQERLLGELIMTCKTQD